MGDSKIGANDALLDELSDVAGAAETMPMVAGREGDGYRQHSLVYA